MKIGHPPGANDTSLISNRIFGIMHGQVDNGAKSGISDLGNLIGSRLPSRADVGCWLMKVGEFIQADDLLSG